MHSAKAQSKSFIFSENVRRRFPPGVVDEIEGSKTGALAPVRSGGVAQIATMGQVMVRVIPSICWMSRTTMRPRSFMEGASTRAMTS